MPANLKNGIGHRTEKGQLVFFFFFYFNSGLITLQYFGGLCHTLTWISHGVHVSPSPEPLSHFLPHPIPLGCSRALTLNPLLHASNLHWSSISYMVIYMFQHCFLKSSHPHLLPQSPKVCSLHLCLFCCFAYRVVIQFSLVAQSCPTLFDPMNRSTPGLPVH